jgi:hypothetical protein
MSVTHRTIKTISSAFDSYMGVFVDAQDKFVEINILSAVFSSCRLTEQFRTCSQPTEAQNHDLHSKTVLLKKDCAFCPLRRNYSTSINRTLTSVPNCRMEVHFMIYALCIKSGCGFTRVRSLSLGRDINPDVLFLRRGRSAGEYEEVGFPSCVRHYYG